MNSSRQFQSAAETHTKFHEINASFSMYTARRISENLSGHVIEFRPLNMLHQRRQQPIGNFYLTHTVILCRTRVCKTYLAARAPLAIRTPSKRNANKN